MLTHWGQVMDIRVSKLNITCSDNGLSPGQCQAIIWTNAGILLIGPLGTTSSETLIKIHTFSFSKMHLKTSSGKMVFILSRPWCVEMELSHQHIIKFICVFHGFWKDTFIQMLYQTNVGNFSASSPLYWIILKQTITDWRPPVKNNPDYQHPMGCNWKQTWLGQKNLQQRMKFMG